ncbi:MAG: hypothetical protein ACD_20C00262G0010 [uncultured bacterium]|nr:MAG: hypothetical protein ACD_20C00262G0010 [uncultured bacterium]
MHESIIIRVDELEPLLIDIRRYLHQYPELSGQEINTANYIYKKLQEAGIESELISTDSGTGVIAYIRAGEGKETIAFRADMDALPVMDKKTKSYASKNSGVTHACGHDFHMAAILGTALTLAKLKNELDINIKFIFQPAEEVSNSGAIALTKAGIMHDVNAIFSVHALPTLEFGKIGIKYGMVSAAIDFFKLTVKGAGGHSARPNEAIDAIFVATNILNCLYSDISRQFNPVDPFVISVGKIQGGTATNIIAETCEIEGTVRTFEQDMRGEILDLIKERAGHHARAYGASVEFECCNGTPPVINDITLARLTEDSAISVIGSENIERMQKPSLGADDFAVYLTYAPGMLIRIGTGGEDSSHPLHSGLFDIDERALGLSVKLLSQVALNYSNSKLYLQKWANKVVV